MAGRARGSGPDPLMLSERLGVLLDYVEATRGMPYTYSEVQDFLKARGHTISRARWSYMVNGAAFRLRDPGLLEGLAELFNVDVAYLLGRAELPPELAEKMSVVDALRRERVVLAATRNLGRSDPEAVEAIREYLETRHGPLAD